MAEARDEGRVVGSALVALDDASSARARCDVETHGVRHSTFTKHIPERYVNPVTPTHC